MLNEILSYSPLSFQAPPLVERYPPGVSYHTCPASTVVSTPELPVRPAPPHQRVCLGVGPVELDFTHGGFARDTELRSSNVAGLLGRYLSLSLSSSLSTSFLLSLSQ